MSAAALIDLASLPLPDALEMLDFEAIYEQRKAKLISLWPEDEQAEVAATVQLESEPLARLLQENSYRELIWRQRVNYAVRAVMLAFAKGNDLEQRAALFGLKRLVIAPADPARNVAQIDENDDSLRERVQLAPQGFSVAGPSAAYETKARAVDGRILDAKSSRPVPGDVLVTILSREGDGTAGQDLIDAVTAALSAEDQRPLNDTVIVKSAEIVRYRIRAKVYTRSAVGADVLLKHATANARAFADKTHRIATGIPASAIVGVCQAAGLAKTELVEPSTDLMIGATQASHCTDVIIEYGGLYA